MVSGLGVLGALTAMVSSHVFHVQHASVSEREKRSEPT
jgi:hypothetical protein